VLNVTRRLIDTRAVASPRRLSAAAAAVLRWGSGEDAEALLPVFLEAPQACAELLPIFARHGDAAIAERLMALTDRDGYLSEDVPSGVLRVLGYLGHEAVEQMLWQHIVREDGGYHQAMDAALGLLHLPCESLRDQIDAALELHLGCALFPEFLPALAVKTGSAAWLGRLVEWGEQSASTDCNGGLILGIALHGGDGRAEFTRMLWNPWWEADASGTGSSWAAYAGARALGIGMAELYGDLAVRLASETDDVTKRHCLSVFIALLDHWLGRPWLGLRMAPDPEESAEELAALLFDWSTPHEDDSLTGLVQRTVGHDSRLAHAVWELERRLDVRMRHEVELQALGSLPS
jgi:hypothetical protein